MTRDLPRARRHPSRCARGLGAAMYRNQFMIAQTLAKHRQGSMLLCFPPAEGAAQWDVDDRGKQGERARAANPKGAYRGSAAALRQLHMLTLCAPPAPFPPLSPAKPPRSRPRGDAHTGGGPSCTSSRLLLPALARASGERRGATPLLTRPLPLQARDWARGARARRSRP